MKLIAFLLSLFIPYSTILCQSNEIIIQDFYKGGVVGDGILCASQNDTVNLFVPIESGSSIRKAYLICTQTNNLNHYPFYFNNEEILLSDSDFLPYSYEVNFNSTILKFYNAFIDVTSKIQPDQFYYPISRPALQPDFYSIETTIFTNFYLLVLYENTLLNQVNVCVIQNKLNSQLTRNYNITNLNPINNENDIGFTINSSSVCDNVNDGMRLFISNSILGIVGGEIDNISGLCSGVTGSFKYQSNSLTGIGNDTPDDIVSGNDALANVQTFVNQNSNSINVKAEYQNLNNPDGAKTNPLHQLFLTYTSTCEAFPVTVSTDTIICRNETVQLSASGGTQYLWQPATDLSCVYCPNPIFTGDSSRFYTVRIWNNDSCSVVRPVKVNVRQLPVFSSITSTPSDCNGATGKIISSANLSGETYSLNGGTPQNSGNFFNLAPGDYTLSVHELNGCTNDTVITVGSSISTNAFFTATPTQGAPPLWVNFTNQSTNASNYEWFLNGISQGNNFPAYLFDTTGNYTVTLVAWPENPSCSDSFELQIYVFDSLIVQVPNVFTPNNDQSNDLFGITTNSPVTVEYQLFNRWGNEMIAGKSSLGTVTSSGLTFTPLWDGNNATEGTYFYKLTVTAQTPKGEQKRALDGFFVLVR